MDQPTEVVCFRCGTRIGAAVGDRFVWVCPKCGAHLELDAGGNTITVTERTRGLSRQLDQIDRDYHREVQQYLMLVGGSRSTRGTYFSPDEAAFQPGAIAFLMVCVSLVLFYIRQWQLGLAGLALSCGIYWFLNRDFERRSEGYKRVTEQWKADRKKIFRALNGE